MFKLIIAAAVLSLGSGPLLAAEEAASGANRENSSQVLLSESPLNYGLDIFFSPRGFPNYVFSNSVQSSDRGGAIQIAFEWIPTTEYGKAGIGVTLGAGVLPNVVIVDNPPPADDSKATLYSFPIGMFFSYRLDYFVNQIIVPYGRLGAGIDLAKQSSKSTGLTVAGVQTFTWFEAAAGAELLLDFVDSNTAHKADQKWGINNTYLFFEYASISSLSSTATINLARNELRFGLRFEM